METPVSVAHGGRDALIPLEMGERIYAAARRKGEWLLVPEATHNDVVIRGQEAYWKWISTALASVTASPAGRRNP